MPPRGRARALKSGFSLLDWNRLTAAASDLAGRKGAPLRRVPLEEVAMHNSE